MPRQLRFHATTIDPPVIFLPSHFTRVVAEVFAADVVVLANLSATHPREEAFSLIGACTILAERNGVVDSLHVEMGMKLVPARRFVRMHC